MNDIEFTDYIVTCETVGCGNSQQAIVIPAPKENPNFICGVCTQQITNVKQVTE